MSTSFNSDTGEVSIRVRQIVQYSWKYFFYSFIFLFLKKGPQKAIMSTATEACLQTRFHIIFYLCKKGLQKAIMGTVTIVLWCYGYPRIPKQREDVTATTVVWCYGYP